ncbi:MAG: HNH endonuclease [Candidatus Eisenbacteria bacterium]|nr:HNH endonuclease [Candidatus Eisenbacteria bacterium]
MRTWIANTDFEWYRFLSGRTDPEEVNFWQPSESKNFHAIPPGAPFLFKLKSPHSAIGGFGFFATASRLPASLAWETFGEMNGAPTFEKMIERIFRYRKSPYDQREDPVIGCRIVGDVVFFPESHWVKQPEDWNRHIVQGKTYDTAQGEGLRVWQECLARAADLRSDWVNDPALREIYEGARFGRPVSVRGRLGQRSFRIAVLDAYGRACAVTTEHSLPVLEAAHIKPYSDGGPHDYGNGILLRSDIHRLFDKGYVSVDPTYRFHVSRRLREEWKNGETYYPFEGRRILLPREESFQPDKRILEWHYEEIFRN